MSVERSQTESASNETNIELSKIIIFIINLKIIINLFIIKIIEIVFYNYKLL